jgi:hypothetical protein
MAVADTSGGTQKPRDAITAMLLQITEQAERLAALGERETGHYRELTTRLAELARQTEATRKTVETIQATAARQAAILDGLDGLDREVATLITRIAGLAGSRAGDDDDQDSYQPGPAPQWWKPAGTEREQALARLRAWVEQIYRPGYGHLAAALGPCWEQHPLCLYGLDWLMELWTVLYLPPERTAPALASQAEWQTRLLPALAEQMYLETTRCQHAKIGPAGPRSPSTARTAHPK